MRPEQLAKVRIVPKKPASPGVIVDRHGYYPKGTVLPETLTPSCPKRKVSDFPTGWLPTKYFEALEHNQLISSCCRHPEDHFIEGFKSHPDERVTDIYVFHCDQCGREHRRFCVGIADENRPEWK